jgi:hypothetical protein
MIVNLVQHESTLYPKTDDDYQTLKGVGIPVTSIEADFMPLLERARKLHKLHFNVFSFADLESSMFEKASAEFPYEITLTNSALVLKAPRKIKEQKLDGFVQKLQRWYSKHSIVLDAQHKRTAKTVKLTLTKRSIRRTKDE